MIRKELREKLNKLHVDDVYSLLLKCLYKLSRDENYSLLCNLAYTLDKDNLLNLLTFYGGTTITIPTLNEFKLVVYSLLLYEYINCEDYTFEEAFEKLNLSSDELIYKQTIIDVYKNIIPIIEAS